MPTEIFKKCKVGGSEVGNGEFGLLVMDGVVDVLLELSRDRFELVVYVENEFVDEVFSKIVDIVGGDVWKVKFRRDGDLWKDWYSDGLVYVSMWSDGLVFVAETDWDRFEGILEDLGMDVELARWVVDEVDVDDPLDEVIYSMKYGEFVEPLGEFMVMGYVDKVVSVYVVNGEVRRKVNGLNVEKVDVDNVVWIPVDGDNVKEVCDELLKLEDGYVGVDGFVKNVLEG